MNTSRTVSGLAVAVVLLTACSAASPTAGTAGVTVPAIGSSSASTSTSTTIAPSSTAPQTRSIGPSATPTDGVPSQSSTDVASLPVLVVHPLTGEADYAVVKPKDIAYSIDVNATIKDITWTSWDATGAVGRGSHVKDDCNPDCASGKIVLIPTTITLTHPVDGQFTSLTETVDGKSHTVTGTGLIEGAGEAPQKIPLPTGAGIASNGGSPPPQGTTTTATVAATVGPATGGTSPAPSGAGYNDPDVLARALLADEVAKGIAATKVTCSFSEPGDALCQLTLTNVPTPIPARVIVSADGRSYRLNSSG